MIIQGIIFKCLVFRYYIIDLFDKKLFLCFGIYPSGKKFVHRHSLKNLTVPGEVLFSMQLVHAQAAAETIMHFK